MQIKTFKADTRKHYEVTQPNTSNHGKNMTTDSVYLNLSKSTHKFKKKA